MDPAPTTPFATLGEDLLILAIDPANGRVRNTDKLPYGLMGSELVRLAAAARIDIADDRIVLRDPAPAGDPQLDQALASIAQSGKPPRPRTWVGHPRRHIRDEYLARLVQAGVLSEKEVSSVLGRRRYTVLATGRLAAARSLLDAIARSAGPVPVSQAAFAGLAHATGLDGALYPGWANRPLRHRLAQIAKGSQTVAAPGSTAVSSAAAATSAAADAAASSAAVTAASAGAVQAATAAAAAAAVAAATAASAASAAASAG
jgi:Golgi phosphoprotein 3 (GPP34)